MGQTLNHKIYSPNIGDTAQARTQMAAMAGSVETALNNLTSQQRLELTEFNQQLIDQNKIVMAEESKRIDDIAATNEALKDYVDEHSFQTMLGKDFGLYTFGENFRGIKAVARTELPAELAPLGVPQRGDGRLLTAVVARQEKPYAVYDNFRGTPIGSGESGTGGSGMQVINSPVGKWVHYGDSLTDWGSPEALAKVTGYTHINAGHASDWAAQVAIRAGAWDYQVQLDGGKIPASGSVALLKHSPMKITTTDGLKYPVSIAGIQGTISQTTSDANPLFTRDTAGAEVSAPGWQAVTVDPVTTSAKQTKGNAEGYSLIIGVGRNDLLNRSNGGNIDSVLMNIRKIIDANKAQVKNIIIWDIPPWSFETLGTTSRTILDEWNARIAAAFPEHFVSITGKLRTDEAFTAAGVTKTAQDDADIAQGLTPSTLRRDTAGHFGDAGNRAWAYFMAQEMSKRGFIRG